MKDGILALGALIALISLFVIGLSFKPDATIRDLLELEVVGSSNVRTGRPLSAPLAAPTAVLVTTNGTKCLLTGARTLDGPVKQLSQLLRPDSSISLKCDATANVEGTHDVVYLEIDGTVVLEPATLRADHRSMGSMSRWIGVVGVLIGGLFIWGGSRQPRDA